MIAGIAKAVTAESHITAFRGLMGPIGIATFLSSARAAGLGHEFDALEALERGLDELGQGVMPLGLWNGAAGIRWVVAQLTTGAESAALLTHLDSQIEARLTALDCDGYDLYSGLSGVLLAYADDEIRGNRILEIVLDHFDRILPLNNRSSFGCAHGLAGALAAIACCHLHGRTDVRAAPLMTALIAALSTADVTGRRVGWCHGDIGIAIALLGAARAFGDPDLEAAAVAIALAPFTRSGARWPIDTGLCHGSAGLGHLYNRMYQATGNGLLGEVAHTWLRRTMAKDSDLLRVADSSLLVGESGLGLALLAGATSATPDWDRVLAADLAPA